MRFLDNIEAKPSSFPGSVANIFLSFFGRLLQSLKVLWRTARLFSMPSGNDPTESYPFLATMFWEFDRVQDTITDYKKLMPDDTVAWHDFQHMIETNLGPIHWEVYASIRDKCPFGRTHLLDPSCRYTTRLTWALALKHTHHVFIDLLVLRVLYPELLMLLAEKPRQLEMLEERHCASGERAPLLHFPKRYAEKDIFSYSTTPIPDVVFAKSKFGAYGEGCQLLLKRNIEENTGSPTWISVKNFSALIFKNGSDALQDCRVKGENTNSWPPLRKSFLMYEECLTNHQELQSQLIKAGLIQHVSDSEHAPLVTFRVWINRFRFQQTSQQESHVSALLVGSADSLCSNANGNQCIRIEEKGVDDGTNSLKGFVRANDGKSTVEIPFYSTLLACSRWVHDQFPEMPFLAFDLAITDKGVFFLEANPMCSYSKYEALFLEKDGGCIYSLEDCEFFLKNLFKKVVRNTNLREHAEKNPDTKRLLHLSKEVAFSKLS